MAKITLNTTNEEFLQSLDEITADPSAEVQVGLESRVKKLIIENLKAVINSHRQVKARKEATFNEVSEDDIT